jgi:hypothetical protein
MKPFKMCAAVVCLAVLCMLAVPTATADENNNKTLVTFSAPFEVPGVGAQVLPAGTYVFKLLNEPFNRHIVQILNQNETHIYTTILAIPNYRLKTTGKTVMTFKERAEGEPEAIRAWFYPGHQWGEEFVYPKSKAIELAKVANEPVLYTINEVATVDDLNTAPIEAVKPTGEAVPLEAVVEAPPKVVMAKLEEPQMPKTASYLPLLACFGLLSLGAAGLVTKYSA